jgi:hypothetical protein
MAIVCINYKSSAAGSCAKATAAAQNETAALKASRNEALSVINVKKYHSIVYWENENV